MVRTLRAPMCIGRRPCLRRRPAISDGVAWGSFLIVALLAGAANPRAFVQARPPAGETARPELILPGRGFAYAKVRISPDDRWFAAASSADGSLSIHDARTGAVLQTIATGASVIEAIAIAP